MALRKVTAADDWNFDLRDRDEINPSPDLPERCASAPQPPSRREIAIEAYWEPICREEWLAATATADFKHHLRPAITTASLAVVKQYIPVKDVVAIVADFLAPAEVLRISIPREHILSVGFRWKLPYNNFINHIVSYRFMNSLLRFRYDNGLPSWPDEHGTGCHEKTGKYMGRTVGHWLREWDCKCVTCRCCECFHSQDNCRCVACPNGKCCPRGSGWRIEEYQFFRY